MGRAKESHLRGETGTALNLIGLGELHRLAGISSGTGSVLSGK
jgi:hypothetical protein